VKYSVITSLPGYVRIALAGRVPLDDVSVLCALVKECSCVTQCDIYPHAGIMVLRYTPSDTAHPLLAGEVAADSARHHASTIVARADASRAFCRHLVKKANAVCELPASLRATLDAITPESIQHMRAKHPYHTTIQTTQLVAELSWLTLMYWLRRLFLPKPLALISALWTYRQFFFEGVKSLLHLRMDVPLLDACAIGVSFLQGKPRCASETMFLLQTGETLEDYTRNRSEGALIDALLDVPQTALRVIEDTEQEVSLSELHVGDVIAIRIGMAIPVDAEVVSGCAMVNQASFTGEPLAIKRVAGDRVFAGTTVEDGEILAKLVSEPEKTRLRSVVDLVKNSEAHKSKQQSRFEEFASQMVPWNFALAGGVGAVTRNVSKASAALMVDYSCGMRLTSSIAVLSAMRACASMGFTVRGSRYFDALAHADTIVFDKTGTITEASPTVTRVLAFGSWNETEVLRFAACLEEHFPHPVARAVVNAAAEKHLNHRERHADVEYIVAHGIVSSLDGKRVVIGSEHFVVEDEGVEISETQRVRIDEQTKGSSPLFLAVDGKLVGVLGITDPLKPGVKAALDKLHSIGVKRIIMLTGDNHRAAAHIASQAGVTEWRANLLPQDKHSFVQSLKEQGARVVMVGDGVNDAPALACADCGVAMGSGSAVAREAADITLTNGNIDALCNIILLSRELMKRMNTSFAQVMGLNTLFMALGILGIVTPQTSSLLHNSTTIGLSILSGRRYKTQKCVTH